MIDLKDIKSGDTVTLEHSDGSRLVREVVTTTAGDKAILPLSPSRDHTIPLTSLLALGWSITDHKPKVELPTEPGWYRSGVNSYVEGTLLLTTDGPWIWVGNKYNVLPEPTDPARHLPLTRLIPENENRAKIAAEVIDWIEGREPFSARYADAREHFGVES